jgi:hypothetical protein
MISLQGSVTLANEVDTKVNVLGTWTGPNSNDVLAFTERTNPPYDTSLMIDPLNTGGTYEFTVTTRPFNPTYIEANNVTTGYTINPLPYPKLVIARAVSSGVCGVNDTATLTGSVELLPSTTTNTEITYTWIDHTGRPVMGDGGTLVINSPGPQEFFKLMACLTIPGTDVEDHCQTVPYSISTDG